jgi:hypothetical protein
MTTLDLKVSADADDCVVSYSGSAWGLDLSEGTWNPSIGYYSATGLKRGTGNRFQNVTIPQFAIIDVAYITVRAQASKSNTTVNSYITGQLGDSSAFSNIADYQARRGTVVGGANNNNITTAKVAWDNVPAFTADTDYNSPSIISVIQEIVNGTWASGYDLTLFFDDHDGRSTAASETRRTIYHYTSSSNYCMKLHIEYHVVDWVPRFSYYPHILAH